MAAKPITPWSVTETEDKKTQSQASRVRFKMDPTRAPWQHLVENRPSPIPRDEERFYEPSVVAPPKKQTAPALESKSVRTLSAKNYVAMEAEGGHYGLIDNGSEMAGCKPLLMHVPRREKHPWRVLNAIRPGIPLRVRLRKGGKVLCLRVQYTTPARYYAPGKRVSTLSIGVDSTDWRSLAAEVSHI